MKITDKQIREYLLREYLLRDPDHIKVTIKRSGHVHVRTNRRRGDGGPTPWSMFAGLRWDIARDLSLH